MEKRTLFLVLFVFAVICSLIPYGASVYGMILMPRRFGLPFGASYDVVIQGEVMQGEISPPIYGYWLTFLTVKVYPLTAEPFLNMLLVYLIVICANSTLFLGVGYAYLKVKI